MTFHQFSTLPTELREGIRLFCLPNRVYELTRMVNDIVFWKPGKSIEDDDEKWPCQLSHTSNVNRAPPAISRICHESRRLSFKYGFFSSGLEPYLRSSGEPVSSHWFLNDYHDRWISLTRDYIHNSWTSAHTANLGYEREIDDYTLQHVAWKASIFTHGASIMIENLDQGYFDADRTAFFEEDRLGPYGLPPVISATQPLSPSKQRDLDALRKIAAWRVVMRVVVVHMDLQTAGKTGLFGLLCDAPIQVVDSTDQR